MDETETHETTITSTTTGAVIAAEAPTPATAAEEFIQPRGSFATGEETTPEKDAADRQHRGSFASEVVNHPPAASARGRKVNSMGQHVDLVGA
jgi:hypothetical protein